ncbi:hypothetical protein PR048_004883 [Dryococelus australis]|uniref:C2H2-type domain-containing protein n=1 Tax=Dryococelus australis TaxID=614101 RepID=A0ABQ9I6N4_9NEOP|nr:hypothetical protein PR048_004883 [Dryococelus australis]
MEPRPSSSLPGCRPCRFCDRVFTYGRNARRHERTACTNSPFHRMKHYGFCPTQFVKGDTMKEHTENMQGFVYWEPATVSLLASHQGVPGSIPGRVTPNFCTWKSCRKMKLVGGFSRGSSVSPRPLHSGPAPYSPRFALIASRDHDVKSRPNMSILFAIEISAASSVSCPHFQPEKGSELIFHGAQSVWGTGGSGFKSQRRNERAGETGNPRENPGTIPICENSKVCQRDDMIVRNKIRYRKAGNDVSGLHTTNSDTICYGKHIEIMYKNRTHGRKTACEPKQGQALLATKLEHLNEAGESRLKASPILAVQWQVSRDSGGGSHSGEAQKERGCPSSMATGSRMVAAAPAHLLTELGTLSEQWEISAVHGTLETAFSGIESDAGRERNVMVRIGFVERAAGDSEGCIVGSQRGVLGGGGGIHAGKVGGVVRDVGGMRSRNLQGKWGTVSSTWYFLHAVDETVNSPPYPALSLHHSKKLALVEYVLEAAGEITKWVVSSSVRTCGNFFDLVVLPEEDAWLIKISNCQIRRFEMKCISISSQALNSNGATVFWADLRSDLGSSFEPRWCKWSSLRERYPPLLAIHGRCCIGNSGVISLVTTVFGEESSWQLVIGLGGPSSVGKKDGSEGGCWVERGGKWLNVCVWEGKWLNVCVWEGKWLNECVWEGKWLNVCVWEGKWLNVCVWEGKWLNVCVWEGKWLNVCVWEGKWLNVCVCEGKWLNVCVWEGMCLKGKWLNVCVWEGKWLNVCVCEGKWLNECVWEGKWLNVCVWEGKWLNVCVWEGKWLNGMCLKVCVWEGKWLNVCVWEGKWLNVCVWEGKWLNVCVWEGKWLNVCVWEGKWLNVCVWEGMCLKVCVWEVPARDGKQLLAVHKQAKISDVWLGFTGDIRSDVFRLASSVFFEHQRRKREFSQSSPPQCTSTTGRGIPANHNETDPAETQGQERSIKAQSEGGSGRHLVCRCLRLYPRTTRREDRNPWSAFDARRTRRRENCCQNATAKKHSFTTLHVVSVSRILWPQQSKRGRTAALRKVARPDSRPQRKYNPTVTDAEFISIVWRSLLPSIADKSVHLKNDTTGDLLTNIQRFHNRESKETKSADIMFNEPKCRSRRNRGNPDTVHKNMALRHYNTAPMKAKMVDSTEAA